MLHVTMVTFRKPLLVGLFGTPNSSSHFSISVNFSSCTLYSLKYGFVLGVYNRCKSSQSF